MIIIVGLPVIHNVYGFKNTVLVSFTSLFCSFFGKEIASPEEFSITCLEIEDEHSSEFTIKDFLWLSSVLMASILVTCSLNVFLRNKKYQFGSSCIPFIIREEIFSLYVTIQDLTFLTHHFLQPRHPFEMQFSLCFWIYYAVARSLMQNTNCQFHRHLPNANQHQISFAYFHHNLHYINHFHYEIYEYSIQHVLNINIRYGLNLLFYSPLFLNLVVAEMWVEFVAAAQ